ncbi:unnamed protein product [Brassicogethes aeneus]|uniref:Uncharacterized protein n=1 Tax=Brassicogethes aeneus TaxID=1431903 RepID=A0A9P0B8B4_BRAAE|nr:unnamed protein product [Brassicogethes aeneus]
MTETDKFQLYVFEGDCGLVSFDPECIQSILLAKLAKLPVKINLLNSIRKCARYTAPSLINKKVVSTNYSEIVSYLRTKNYNIDQSLSPKQCSEMLALTTLANSKLRPVVDFFFWMDARNSEDFTTMWYMRALPLPFNFMHTRREKNKVADLMEALYPNDTNVEIIKNFMIKSATQCLTSFSSRLGKQDYFFGSTPTTVDIIVYSYIAPLIKLPFPSSEFKNLFNLWPNLTMFVKRIDAKYLPDVSVESKYLKKDEKIKSVNDDDVSYTAIAIIILSAASIIFGFAVNRGFIQT